MTKTALSAILAILVGAAITMTMGACAGHSSGRLILNWLGLTTLDGLDC